MTTYYVRSTDGNNADSGLTWALAKLDGAGFGAVDAAGDVCWVSQAHAEVTVGGVTWTFAGTPAAPTVVVCGNDASEPPVSLATTATVTINAAAQQLAIRGSCYVYGITFINGNGALGSPSIRLGGGSSVQKYESCKFQIASTGGSAVIAPSTAGGSGSVVWKNCEVKFANAAQGLQIQNGYWNWNGGGVTAGGTSPTALIVGLGTGGTAFGLRALIENCDFSSCSAGVNLVGPQPGYAYYVVFRNCKLPASWSGSLCPAFTSDSQGRVEMYNCSSGSVNYALQIRDGCGSIDHETTYVRSGGATDGVTSLSWKMATTAAVGYPASSLLSGEIVRRVNTVGSPITVAVSILHDSATNLKDNEVWLEVNYLGSSSYPVGSLITDQVADYVTTAADQSSDSSSTWTTTGMANPNKQKLSVTFTPQMKGYIHVKVALAKASKTVYVDPKLQIS